MTKAVTVDFIDLFAGIGGFRLALEEFGFNCVFSSEIDNEASTVYEENFGARPIGDITKVNAADIPPHNILCGGFPCQPFSIAGNKRGFEDIRGTLFFEIARIVDHHKPQILLLENVKNLATHDKGRTLRVIVETLDRMNYNVFHSVIDASSLGVPTSRQRVYIVGLRKDLPASDFTFPKPKKSFSIVQDFLCDQVEDYTLVDRLDVVITNTAPKRTNKPLRVGYLGGGRQGERIYSPLGTAITFSASGGGPGGTSGLYLVDNNVRRLSPRECFNIMGFPEDFKLSKNRRSAYKQIGNSVAIPVLHQIMQNIITTIFKGAINDIR